MHTPKNLLRQFLRNCLTRHQNRRVPPCAVKTCAVRPVFARVVGELRAADPSNVHGPVKQNASPEAQSEAPRRGWKPGQGQNPGPENQDNQHMLEQPRGSFPDKKKKTNITSRGIQWNPKYGWKGTVTTRFALIALVAWQY